VTINTLSYTAANP